MVLRGRRDGTVSECLAVLFITVEGHGKREGVSPRQPLPTRGVPLCARLIWTFLLFPEAMVGLGRAHTAPWQCAPSPSSQQGRDEEVEPEGSLGSGAGLRAGLSGAQISTGPVWLRGGPRREGPAGQRPPGQASVVLGELL